MFLFTKKQNIVSLLTNCILSVVPQAIVFVYKKWNKSGKSQQTTFLHYKSSLLTNELYFFAQTQTQTEVNRSHTIWPILRWFQPTVISFYSLFVPGHSFVLQSSVSSPDPGQWRPPFLGSGLSHILILDRFPLPHVREQSVQADQ